MLFAEKLFVCPGVSQSSFVFILNNKPSLDYSGQCPISHKNHIVCTSEVQNSKCSKPPPPNLEKQYLSTVIFLVSAEKKCKTMLKSRKKTLLKINMFLKYIQLSNIAWILH